MRTPQSFRYKIAAAVAVASLALVAACSSTDEGEELSGVRTISVEEAQQSQSDLFPDRIGQESDPENPDAESDYPVDLEEIPEGPQRQYVILQYDELFQQSLAEDFPREDYAEDIRRAESMTEEEFVEVTDRYFDEIEERYNAAVAEPLARRDELLDALSTQYSLDAERIDRELEERSEGLEDGDDWSEVTDWYDAERGAVNDAFEEEYERIMDAYDAETEDAYSEWMSSIAAENARYYYMLEALYLSGSD